MYMDFLTLAKKRYSCRSYKPDAVEDEKLMRVLEAGRIAPSAANLQPWHFMVVRSPENLAKVAACYSRDWLKTAPLIIIVCGDHTKAWQRKDGKDHTDVDISIAVDHMTLQATASGLATCWICAFDAARLTETFHLPGHIEPVALFPLGYPNDTCDTERHHTARKKLNEITHWEELNAELL
jgi:nitroreductase